MPRGRGKVEVSLFPFLSVLCCMIGVFMLFLVAILSTRVIDAQEEEARQPPPRPREQKHGNAAETDPDSIDAESYRLLEQRLIELTGQLTSRRAERDELERRLDALRAALDAKRDELAVGQPVKGRRPVELDKPDPVRPVPDPNFRVPKKPVYIEVNAEGYLVQPGKVRYPPLTKKRVKDEDVYMASREFKQFLVGIDENRQRQYVLILVHPSGAEGYWALRNYLLREFHDVEKSQFQVGNIIYERTTTKHRIDVGSEPFSRDWQFIAEQPQP